MMRYGTKYEKLREKVIQNIDLVKAENLESASILTINDDNIGELYINMSRCVACTSLKMLVYEDGVVNYTSMYLLTSIKNVRELIEEIRKDMDVLQDAKDTVLGGDSVSPVGVYETTVAYLANKGRNVVKNKGYMLGRIRDYDLIVIGRTNETNGSAARKDFKLLKIRVDLRTGHYVYRDIDGYYVYAIDTKDNRKVIKEYNLEVVE